MQRGFLQASHVPTSYIVGRNLALCVDYDLCLLEVSLCVVCTCHGVPRKKVRRRKLLRWAPIYVAESHWHTAASRNWKVHLRLSQQQRLLRSLWSRNPMKWVGRFTSCDLTNVHLDSGIAWKHTERCSNKNRLRYNHRERGFISGPICSFSDRSSVLERRHRSCTEDYSSMRGSLGSAFEDCKTIDKIFHQQASDVEQKVKELQVRVGDLMIVIVDHVTLKDEDTKETVVMIAEGIEQDIKELLRCG